MSDTMRRMFTKKQIEEIAKGKLGPAIASLEERALSGVVELFMNQDDEFFIDDETMAALESGAYKLVCEEEELVSLFFYDSENSAYLAVINDNIYKGAYTSGDLVFDSSNVFDPIAQIEAGGVTNAKPIYCHPIWIAWDNETHTEFGNISCLIFNNTSTPFTLSTFKTYIDNLRRTSGEDVRIVASGGFVTASGQYSDGKITIANTLYEISQNYLQLQGVSVDSARTNIITLWATIADNVTNFTDGVNKLN